MRFLPARSKLLLALLLPGVPGVAAAQTLTELDALSFGLIEYAAQPPTGVVRLAPNGTVTYTGDMNGEGTGVAGRIQMSGTTDDVVEVRCTASATLARAGGGTVAMDEVKVSVGTPQTYAAATACQGTGTTVLTPTLSAVSSDNIIYLGGQLNPGGSSVGGSYSTGTVGGAEITVRVIFP